MIELNRNSFIHKMNLFMSNKGTWYWNDIDNLCEYFWATVRNILIFLIKVSIVAVVGGGILWGIGMSLYSQLLFDGNPMDNGHWEVFSWWMWVTAPIVTLLFAGSIIGTSFLIVLFVRTIFCSVRWVVYKIIGKKSKREPSIFFEFIKAKKSKYCPRMKIV